MKTIIFLLFGIVVGLFLYTSILKVRNSKNAFPPVSELEHRNGMIIHPTYGEYPEKVKFEQGMTLMPGQSAAATVGIHINQEEK